MAGWWDARGGPRDGRIRALYPSAAAKWERSATRCVKSQSVRVNHAVDIMYFFKIIFYLMPTKTRWTLIVEKKCTKIHYYSCKNINKRNNTYRIYCHVHTACSTNRMVNKIQNNRNIKLHTCNWFLYIFTEGFIFLHFFFLRCCIFSVYSYFWTFNIHIFTSAVSAKCFPSSVLLHLQSLILTVTLTSRRQTSKKRPPRSPPG